MLLATIGERSNFFQIPRNARSGWKFGSTNWRPPSWSTPASSRSWRRTRMISTKTTTTTSTTAGTSRPTPAGQTHRPSAPAARSRSRSRCRPRYLQMPWRLVSSVLQLLWCLLMHSDSEKDSSLENEWKKTFLKKRKMWEEFIFWKINIVSYRKSI